MHQIQSLNAEEVIRAIIQNELKTIIYSNDTSSAPYIKYILIATSIEYLGACADQFPFIEEGHSEDRFNNALKTFFPKKYHQYAKGSSIISLYQDYRCFMIHQFRPSIRIELTTRDAKHEHLKVSNEKLMLVLEDLYDDLERACNKLFLLKSQGKIPNITKYLEDYIIISDAITGSTETRI